MTVQLRDGTAPEAALRTLHDVLTGASNAGGGISPENALSSYLDWVERADGQLRNVFDEPEIWSALYSELHWRVRRMGEAEPRPLPLLRLEVGRQTERLEGLKSEIQRLQRWAEVSDGMCAVLDTNVLLHFQPPRQIDWQKVIGSQRVRLLVPIRVVEELDEKKYASNERLAKRARSLFSDLGDVLLSSGHEPTEVREGITLEVAQYDEPRQRPLDADWEILLCCLSLTAYSPDLVLVTGDIAMRIRAQALGIGLRTMPDQYLRSASSLVGDDTATGAP